MLRWHWLGRGARYRRVLGDQLAAREAVWAGAPGCVLLCEHPPVLTLGRSATLANIHDASGIEIERVERGGEVTYHGPGQLMIYAIVRVKSVVGFLERVAGAIVDASRALGVDGAAWRRDPAGVWLGDRKIAACGIHVARGVPVHGFALDVATPPLAWQRIRPCGLEIAPLSLSSAAGHPIEIETAALEVGPRVAAALSES